MSWSNVIYRQIGSADRLFQLCYPSSAASDPSISSNVLGARGLPWCTPDWTTLWVKKNCATFIFTVKADTHYPFERAVLASKCRIQSICLPILADRTVALMLQCCVRLSVVCLSMTLCNVAKTVRSRAKSKLTAYTSEYTGHIQGKPKK